MRQRSALAHTCSMNGGLSGPHVNTRRERTLLISLRRYTWHREAQQPPNTSANQQTSVRRTVVIEFDSLAQGVAAHDSPAYQAALAALGNGAERDLRIVEGISG
jgi:Domain of unknown function (DUF1330)